MVVSLGAHQPQTPPEKHRHGGAGQDPACRQVEAAKVLPSHGVEWAAELLHCLVQPWDPPSSSQGAKAQRGWCQAGLV